MVTIQQVLQLHQQGKLSEAEQGYRALLKANPQDVNANYLYGKLLLDSQHPSQALPLLSKALKAARQIDAILVAYAECLMTLGRDSEAISVVAGQIHHNEACAKLYLKAKAKLCSFGELNQAYDALVKHWPDKVSVRITMAQLADEKRELGHAKSLYEWVLARQPDSHIALHNLATVERRLGDSTKALALLNKARVHGLQTFQLYHNLGNAYSDLNMLDEGIEAYQSALKLNPYYVDSYKNLTSILASKGDVKGALGLYESAFAKGIQGEALLLDYTEYLIRLGKAAAAKSVIATHLASPDNSAKVAILAAKVAYLENDISAAIQLLANVDTEEAILLKAEYQLQINHTDDIFNTLPKLTSLPSSHIMAKAYLSVAERLSQKNSHRHTYCAYEQLVKTYYLPDTLAGDDPSTACEQLAARLRAKHSATSAPLQQTLNGGTQTRGNIFRQDSDAMLSTLEAFCIESIHRYMGELSVSGLRHPYLPQPFDDIDIVGAWSVNLKNEGYHSNHVHPEGQLSAVFYVDIPDDLNASTQEGYLTFGKPNFKLPVALNHEYAIQPEVGKLVIFPSYFWHGTIPFKSSRHRLTIAFDVAAKNTGLSSNHEKQ